MYRPQGSRVRLPNIARDQMSAPRIPRVWRLANYIRFSSQPETFLDSSSSEDDRGTVFKTVYSVGTEIYLHGKYILFPTY